MGFKNHLGVFQLPEKVLISPAFLATLPQRELRSGYAEVIKHGLIRDLSFFRSLPSSNWEKQDWFRVIRHSVGIKKQLWKWIRKKLDFEKFSILDIALVMR